MALMSTDGREPPVEFIRIRTWPDFESDPQGEQIASPIRSTCSFTRSFCVVTSAASVGSWRAHVL